METTSRKADQGDYLRPHGGHHRHRQHRQHARGELRAGGQDFLLAGSDQDAARKIAADLGGHAEAVSIDEAVERADVLVFALWMDAFEQLIVEYGGGWAAR